jgi:ketosteroid isomerase-like protein
VLAAINTYSPIMNYRLYILIVIFFPFFNKTFAQNEKTSIDSLRNAIDLWNSSFNSRDTNLYYKLIDPNIAVTAGGGTIIGTKEFKETTNSLFFDRVGIVMYMNLEKVEIGGWDIGYDSGNWIETWNEKNTTAKSEIKGKYWRMWKKTEGNWIVMSIILTPMTFKNY